MNKFKSVFLLGFICIGSQVGFPSGEACSDQDQQVGCRTTPLARKEQTFVNPERRQALFEIINRVQLGIGNDVAIEEVMPPKEGFKAIEGGEGN